MSNKRIWIASLLFVSVLALLALAVYIYIVQLFTPERWTIDTINDDLTVPIPIDAINLSFDGHLGRGGYLTLEFQASSASIAAFVSQLCGGVLYDAYDPFNAIDVAEPYTFAHPMHLDIYSYFSYSIGLRSTIKGNRCLQSKPGYQVQVRVDSSQTQMHALKLDLRFGCDIGCPHVPTNVVNPADEFPLSILGLRGTKNPYKLVDREACINVDNSDYKAAKWGYLKDARVEINVDGRNLATAVLNDNSQLLSRANAAGEVAAETSGGLWYYCVDLVSNKLIKPKEIILSITIYPTTQKPMIYSWQVQMD